MRKLCSTHETHENCIPKFGRKRRNRWKVILKWILRKEKGVGWAWLDQDATSPKIL
jgi:hypothetical protein